MLHVLCCHLSHPSHWRPSCRGRTGSLQRMQQFGVDILLVFEIVKAEWKQWTYQKRCLYAHCPMEVNTYLTLCNHFILFVSSHSNSKTKGEQKDLPTKDVHLDDESFFYSCFGALSTSKMGHVYICAMTRFIRIMNTRQHLYESSLIVFASLC